MLSAQRSNIKCLKVLSRYGCDITRAFNIAKNSNHKGVTQEKRNRCLAELSNINIDFSMK